MKGKTLLIIGAGHEQVPAIEIAKARGIRVVVTDRDPGAPGVRLADAFHEVSTGDKEGNLEAARRERVDGVMTLGSETAVPVVARVAAVLGLPGYTEETALKATNKNAMREAFARHGVPAPASRPVRDYEEARVFAEAHGYPVVVKPSDCSGQRGTTRVDGPGELAGAVAEALPFATDGRAIVERFCAGPEINVTAVVSGGRVHFLSLSDRVTAEPPHFGIAVEHVSPPGIPAEMAEKIREASLRAIEATGLRDGIAYPQVIAGEDGEAHVLEIAVRIPGGHMREVAWLMSGIDMIEVAILQALGEEEPLTKCARSERAAALCVKFITELDFPGHGGCEVAGVTGLEEARVAEGVRLARLYLREGRALPPLNSSAARFGAVIATGCDRSEARARARAAADRVRIAFKTES